MAGRDVSEVIANDTLDHTRISSRSGDHGDLISLDVLDDSMLLEKKKKTLLGNIL
jgi:hypothetical protein